MAKLPALMYHNVTVNPEHSKGLTISRQNLEEQFKYLTQKGYTSLHLHELEGQAGLPHKSILITFDDVTVNQLDYAVPLLKKYNLKAVFFIPFHYVGQADLWNKGEEQIMSLAQLKSIDSSVVEYGYHSFMHRRYAVLSDDEINDDFIQCRRFIEEHGLLVYPAVAYPYGNYPKKEPAKSNFKQLLEKNGMKMGFKIGNRVNRFPLKDKYEIQRIDIKGEDTLLRFKLKLRFGKLRLF